MAATSDEYIRTRFPEEDQTRALLQVSGVNKRETTGSLVVNLYRKMLRKTIRIPCMINNDNHLQIIIFPTERGWTRLEILGLNFSGLTMWRKESLLMSLMNSRIASFQLPVEMVILRSNGMARIMTYCVRKL